MEDNGPGIDAVDLPLIFEKFYRGKKSAPRGKDGMGLAIARAILAAHGGAIEVDELAGTGNEVSVLGAVGGEGSAARLAIEARVRSQTHYGLVAPVALDVAVSSSSFPAAHSSRRAMRQASTACDRGFAVAQQRIADARVEEPVVAGNRVRRVGSPMLPSVSTASVPQDGGFLCPSLRLCDARDLVERGFLRVDAPLPVIALRAAQVKAGPRQRRETSWRQGDGEARDSAADGEGIVRAFAVALAPDFGADRLGLAEEREAWSTMCVPRSSRMPPCAGSFFPRRASRAPGRQRSKLDSKWTSWPSDFSCNSF